MEDCPRCRRHVSAANLERHLAVCDGDPSSTCGLYGCGLAAATRTLESSGGRSRWMSWCAGHRPDRESVEPPTPSAAKPGPRQRPSELAERAGASSG